MIGDFLRFFLTAFVTLLVVVDPFGVIPTFVTLTAGMRTGERQRVLRRAVVVGCGIALFFAVAGRVALSFLGVTIPAFAISGGILLFATALPMLFGQRGGLQAPEGDETPYTGDDPSVFPLAIPLLSGPGALTSILLLADQTHEHAANLPALIVGVIAVFVVAYGVLRIGTWFIARIGEGGLHVATRVLGMVVAAVAVQYVLNGITGYYHALRLESVGTPP